MKKQAFWSRTVLLMVLALVFSSLLAGSLLVARMIYSGQITYIFLGWNLFLAWVPLLLAVAMVKVRKRPWFTAGLGGLWLLFFPNALYLVTDLMHLQYRSGVPAWYDAIMLFVFALTGLFLGLWSLRLVQGLVRRGFGAMVGWLFVVLALSVSSFGVYIGRFLRWNSWDALIRPFAVVVDVLLTLLQPAALLQMMVVTGALTAVFLFSFIFLMALPAEAAAGLSPGE